MVKMAVPDLRNNSYYINKLSASTKSLGHPGYEELALSCFPPHATRDHGFMDQQRLYGRLPYSAAMNTLNQPVQFPSHQAIQIQEPILPKFPPQMFDIPDIHDSNSVFGECAFPVGVGFSKSALHHLPFEPSTTAAPVCRTLMSFPGEWCPPGYISVAAAAAAAAAGSTNSSPLTLNEENNGYDVPISQPLTQHQNVFNSSASKTPVKKTKSPKKRKRKDPNEPQKPVSAYSLFFRNAQSAIKSRNPNATFGDISKIVASMWDNLDNEVKRFYKRQMEAAKKEYLKQLAVYRASLSTQQEGECQSTSSKEDTDQPAQQVVSAKVSSSSSSSSSSSASSSSSLHIGHHADDSISQGPSASSAVKTQDHQTIQHHRPSSVEAAAAAAVHKLPISQHAMSHQQQQQQSAPVYFKDPIPSGGPSHLQNGLNGIRTNVAPAMSQNMLHSYNTERPGYFGSEFGISHNHYMDSRYTAAGIWNHSVQTDEYMPKCIGWTPWPK